MEVKKYCYLSTRVNGEPEITDSKEIFFNHNSIGDRKKSSITPDEVSECIKKAQEDI